MMESVKIVPSTVEVKRFDWPCPDCGVPLHKLFEMPDNREMFCQDCSNKQWEASKEKWVKQFKAHWAMLKGAIIIDVEPDLDNWSHFTPENADVAALIVEKNSGLMRVYTYTDIPYLYVEFSDNE